MSFDKLFDGSDAHLIQCNSTELDGERVAFEAHWSSYEHTMPLAKLRAWLAWQEATKQARAQLDHVPDSGKMVGWQPIETAPTETGVLIMRNGELCLGIRWIGEDWNDESITHWMPLPTPPEGVK